MKHIANRLLPYVDNNKIIHINYLNDNPTLKKLAIDKRVNGKIRSALKSFDNQIELLIPYQVDDHESQLKRYIQNMMGTRVNLSDLKKHHYKHYLKLSEYGSPAEVLQKWGLEVAYNRYRTEVQIKDELEKWSKNGVVSNLYKDNESLYMAVFYMAKKKGQSVTEYVEGLGYVYNKGGQQNAK